MNSRVITVPVLSVALFVIGVGSAFGQNGPTLILETEPEETTIPLTGDVSLLSTGDIRATPVDGSACQASSTCEGVQVLVESFDSDIETSAGIEVDEGESFSLAWSSLGAISCSGGGDFSAWSARAQLAPDSRDEAAAGKLVTTKVGDAADSPYKLTIQCSNGTVASAVSAVSTIPLTVNEYVAPSPTSCEGREPIPDWQRLTTGSLSCLYEFGLKTSADCREWSPNLWSGPFLESAGLPKRILTNVSANRQYVAIKFTTDGLNPKAYGQFSVESAGAGVFRERVLATISQCPGDFNPEQVTGCYLNPGTFSPFRWRAPDSTGFSTDCVLEPDTTYYLNMLSSTSPLGTLPEKIVPSEQCETERCGLLIAPRLYDQ